MITLEVKDLAKRFGRKFVFKGLNFSENSRIIGISGSNGSGKSTILKCLSFLYKPTNGSVVWFDENSKIEATDFKRILGYAAPYLNLYAEFSAIENIQFQLELKQISFSRKQIEEIGEQLGINFSLDQTFGSLSSGQQQRVKLLSAFSGNSKLIFLDEPGTNLDESGIDAVLSLVKKAHEQDRTVVLASNSTKELAVCDVVHSLNQVLV